jgi:hypothetical protein
VSRLLPRYLLHTPKIRLKQYFLRRLTRPELPYFLSLIMWAAVQFVVVHRSSSNMAPHLAASSVYLHNLIFGGFPGAVNTIAGSLEFEVQFYVLVPLLSMLFAIADARLEGKRSFLWDALSPFAPWPLVWLLGRDSGHIVLPFVIVILNLAVSRANLLRDLQQFDHHRHWWNVLQHLPVPLHHHLRRKRLLGKPALRANFWLYFTLQCCLITPTVLLFCGTFFLLVERPWMDREWPMKLWRQGQALMLSAARQPQS